MGGTAEAVLFGRPHGHQLPPQRQEGAEFVGLAVRQGPGGGSYRLGTTGQGLRTEGIRLGQRPGGFGEATGLAGIDHRYRKASRSQGCHHGALVASRGCEHNEGGLHGLEPRHQGGNPGVIVGHGPPFASGPQGDSELGFRHINTNTKLWSRHQDS